MTSRNLCEIWQPLGYRLQDKGFRIKVVTCNFNFEPGNKKGGTETIPSPLEQIND
jgi:hypothetical protein